MREAVLAQLEALKAQGVLIVSQADALIRMLEQVWPAAAPVEPEESADGQCLHPVALRVPAATSGHPARFACRRCRQWGGLRDKES